MLQMFENHRLPAARTQESGPEPQAPRGGESRPLPSWRGPPAWPGAGPAACGDTTNVLVKPGTGRGPTVPSGMSLGSQGADKETRELRFHREKREQNSPPPETSPCLGRSCQPESPEGGRARGTTRTRPQSRHCPRGKRFPGVLVHRRCARAPMTSSRTFVLLHLNQEQNSFSLSFFLLFGLQSDKKGYGTRSYKAQARFSSLLR